MKHPGTFEHKVGITPKYFVRGTRSVDVLIADINSPYKCFFPVNDNDLSVVPVIQIIRHPYKPDPIKRVGLNPLLS